MTETKVNARILGKFSRTVVNRVKTDMPDVTGKILDGFHIDRKMDVSSGEADLYLCHRENGGGSFESGSPDSENAFVLKLFRREDALKPQVLEKIRNLRSPCVAPIVHSALYENHRYVVLPYYRYPSLGDVIAGGQTFSEKDLRDMVIPCVSEGLRALHEAGVLHKDLKPSNLMLDNSGKRVVIIDFGISTDTGGKTFVVTRTGMTPLYAAPEALQGVYHRETDYYAFGVTIYELFTGHRPFQENGVSEQEALRLSAVSGISFPENFPEDLQSLVLGLTYRDLSHRNEPDNPNRRWGFEEIAKWLRGEKLPVPGDGSAAAEAGAGRFLPYSFDSKVFTVEDGLLEAFLENPGKGLRELGRGMLTHHYGYFDEFKAAVCHEAEETLGNSEETNLNLFRNLVQRLRAVRTGAEEPIFFSGSSYRTLGDLGAHLFPVAVPVLPGTVFPEEIRLFESWINGDVPGWFAEKYLRDQALARSLEDILSFTEARNLSGIYRILVYLTELHPSCRKIVVMGRWFDTTEDFGRGISEATVSESSCVMFLEEALRTLDNGYLEACIIRTDQNPEKQVALLGEIRSHLDSPEFLGASLKMKCCLMGYFLGGVLKFPLNGRNFSGASDFASFTEEMKNRDQEEYLAFIREARRDLERLRSFVREDEALRIFNESLDSIMSATFGDGEYFFKNPAEFLKHIEDLKTAENYDELGYIFEKYHTALQDLDIRCWKSGAFQKLGEILEGTGSEETSLSYMWHSLKTRLSSSRENTGVITVNSERYAPVIKIPELSPDYVPGEYVRFGTWQIAADGPASPIDWIVVEVTETHALLLSRLGLASGVFHESFRTNIDWLMSSLRTWLNTDFYRQAFSEEDRKRIYTSEDFPEAVFCLSQEETQAIPAIRGSRTEAPERLLCYASPHALLTHPFQGQNGSSPWWLRSMGSEGGRVLLIWTDGTVLDAAVNEPGNLIRPAIRIRV